MRLLITGARGQLGHAVAKASMHRGYLTLALARDRLDITDASSADRVMADNAPDMVVNCAAYTAVDRAEEEPQLAFAVNRDGASNLAAACAQSKVPLIHVSTDYVFDGTQKDPYTETDTVHPINVYGASKASGETEIQNTFDRFIILRTAWVFGVHGNNFVKTMLRLGQERQTLRVVDDQFGCPTFSGHLAEAIMRIVANYRRRRTLPWGIYHYGGQPPVNWYAFAEHIFLAARTIGIPLKVERLEAIPSHAYPLPAKRAANSMLDCSKFKRVFGMDAALWQDGVQAVVADWHKTIAANDGRHPGSR